MATPETTPPPAATAPPPEASAPAAPGLRERWARNVLGTASAAILLVALLHAGGYFFASMATEYSGVKSEYHAVFRGLRLGFALQSAIVAVVLAIAALRPPAVSRPVIVLCGLLPLVGTAMVAWSTSSLVASVLLAVTALLIVAGALLRPPEPGAPTGADFYDGNGRDVPVRARGKR
jgi:hypothetical protein